MELSADPCAIQGRWLGEEGRVSRRDASHCGTFF